MNNTRITKYECGCKLSFNDGKGYDSHRDEKGSAPNCPGHEDEE